MTVFDRKGASIRMTRTCIAIVALCVQSFLVCNARAQTVAPASVQRSPLAQVKNGRQAGDNNRLVATGIRSPALASNHALIITVSQYLRSPLPGVLKDRQLAIDLALRFGVPQQNIVQLSEEQVTREGVKQALADLSRQIMPGDRLYVYFSGHGARFFDRSSGQCMESIVMQDMHVLTNDQFAEMVKPLSAKSDKTVVMLDSCHSGGVAQATTARDLTTGSKRMLAKFSAEASSSECSHAVNIGSFSNDRGIEFATTDNNLVILAAARNNEVAWDTSQGGALTYSITQCIAGAATDTDQSGSISMQELTNCVQSRLDHSQEESTRQHATLVGNGALVPAFTEPTPTPNAAVTVNSLGTLNDIFSQRDDRWEVQATLSRPTLKIGDNLEFTIASKREGYVYIFYRGSQPDSFYLLFPNQMDANNAIAANQELHLPRKEWSVTALGPSGTDHLLVMVTETPRDFSGYALPADYVSRVGPFDKIHSTPQAMSQINQIATLSAAIKLQECQGAAADRDLGIARRCSSAFGASLLSVDEIK